MGPLRFSFSYDGAKLLKVDREEQSFVFRSSFYILLFGHRIMDFSSVQFCCSLTSFPCLRHVDFRSNDEQLSNVRLQSVIRRSRETVV